eukprot:127438-Chlamydomonas_euryale.AAC.1
MGGRRPGMGCVLRVARAGIWKEVGRGEGLARAGFRTEVGRGRGRCMHAAPLRACHLRTRPHFVSTPVQGREAVARLASETSSMRSEVEKLRTQVWARESVDPSRNLMPSGCLLRGTCVGCGHVWGVDMH